MYLTEAEDIKKRWQEYTEELYKKDLQDPDNYDGVITHLESDILECEVKWALGNITMNKDSGGDGIPAKPFQILLRCYTQYVSKFGKLSSGHRTGKGQFSFQSQRKAMPKNVQTTAQFHLSSTYFQSRRWHPTPGESQGQGSLMGCRLCGHTESDMTKAT